MYLVLFHIAASLTLKIIKVLPQSKFINILSIEILLEKKYIEVRAGG